MLGGFHLEIGILLFAVKKKINKMHSRVNIDIQYKNKGKIILVNNINYNCK